MQAWKSEVEGRCDKVRSLQHTVEGLSVKAGAGNAVNLVDKLNGLSDRMNALLAKTAVRQVRQGFVL